MTMLLAGTFYGMLMFAAGIAIGEALSERRARNAEQIIHDEWDAACKTCHTCDMSRTRQGS